MYALFDIGGTKTRVAVSKDGRRFGTPHIYNTPKKFTDGMSRLYQVACDISKMKKFKGVAGGIAGPLDGAKTKLVNSPNIGGWINKPLKQELKKRFKAPAVLENDAATVGLGEATAGAGKGKSIVAYLTISTGVGGARIVDGAIDRSAFGFEPGHHIIDINCKQEACDSCGTAGDLESLVSGSGLQRRYKKDPKNITDSKIWNETAHLLAIGLNNVAVFWSPDVIVLGGGIAVGRPGFVPLVEKHFKRIVTIFPQKPLIRKASLKDVGGLYGALALARKYCMK